MRRKDGRVRMEAELGMMLPQAKDAKAAKAGQPPPQLEAERRIPLQVSEKAQPCQYLDFELLASTPVKDKFLP